jgi:hypothetical protein
MKLGLRLANTIWLVEEQLFLTIGLINLVQGTNFFKILAA